MTRTSKHLLAATVLVCALAVGAASWDLLRRKPQVGIKVESTRWLPRSATAISFVRKGRALACEFQIPRDDLERWAAAQGWNLRPIEGQMLLPRFTLSLPPGHPERVPPYYVIAVRGLGFREHGGRGTSLYYDEATSTAYWVRVP